MLTCYVSYGAELGNKGAMNLLIMLTNLFIK